MAESTIRTYGIQIISQRYIRKNVFEEYVNARLDRFGSEWTGKWARDNKISFTSLETLTNDELDFLQETSHEARSLFV